MHTRYEMYRTRKQKHTLLKLVGKQKQFLQGCAGFGPTRAQVGPGGPPVPRSDHPGPGRAKQPGFGESD